MTKLIEEPPLLVLPSLAVQIGLNEAIAAQQIHWLIEHYDSRAVEIDGVRYLKADLEFWNQQFPWWSETTIRRILTNLDTLGLVTRKRGREANVYSVHPSSVQNGRCQRPDRTDDSDQIGRSPCKGEGTTESGEEEQHLPGLAPPPAPTPPSPAAVVDDSKVEDIWAVYARVFDGRFRVGLNDDKRKMLRKALKAVEDDAELCKRAILGLQSYRERNPHGSKDVSLGTIFSTRPGGRVLSEQIEFWASQAEGDNAGSAKSGIGAEVPTVLHDRIVRRRISVVEMLQQPDNGALKERGEEALAWLREHAKEEPVITDGRVEDWVKIA